MSLDLHKEVGSVISKEKDSTLLDYIALLKPRVMSLVLFSGIVGMVLNPAPMHPFIALIAIVCIALGAGASGAINMWYDRDIDSIMSRTKSRPLVQGKMEDSEALATGIVIAFLSVFVMAVCVNYLSAFLLAFTILYYVFIYTIWLKRRSVQNIVIGGLSGALPPLIGWASVSNSISLEPIILVLIIFLWTPPHSWALALYRYEDYKRANVPMMPVIYGDAYTKYMILIYTLLTFVATTLPFLYGFLGFIYLSAAIILGVCFVYLSWKLIIDRENKLAPKLFIFSIFYLFLLFLAMVIDHYANFKFT